MMGCGIAAAALASGEKVTIVESNPLFLERVSQRVKELLSELVKNDLLTGGTGRIDDLTVCNDLTSASQNAAMVIEAIVEDLPAKQALFQTLDELLPPEVIISSNTSGLRITDIAANAIHKERIATTHFWFPAHLVPLVEVVMSSSTSSETAQWLRERLLHWGKAPVIVKQDLPGQLANRILQAVIREASNIVEIGLASPEDVDTAVKMGMGIRFPVWGPLEHVDAVGIDLCAHVQDTVLPSISVQTSSNQAFQKKPAENNLGYKTGCGFYDWSKKDMHELEHLRNDFIIQSVKFIRNRQKNSI